MNQTSTTHTIEFLDALAETIDETLTAAMEKTDTPQEVKDLARSLYGVTVSILHVARGNVDEEFTQKAISDAVNSVTNAGGVFYTASGATMPRKGTLLSQ